MLSVRNKTGGSELHEHYADIFFVVDGEATLTSGGTMVDPKTTEPGEVRGSAVSGGVEQKLGKGDVVHIPPNTPHQLSIPKGKSFHLLCRQGEGIISREFSRSGNIREHEVIDCETEPVRAIQKTCHRWTGFWRGDRHVGAADYGGR